MCVSFFAHNMKLRVMIWGYNSAYRGYFMPEFYIINVCYSKQSPSPSFTHPNLKTEQRGATI